MILEIDMIEYGSDYSAGAGDVCAGEVCGSATGLWELGRPRLTTPLSDCAAIFGECGVSGAKCRRTNHSATAVFLH